MNKHAHRFGRGQHLIGVVHTPLEPTTRIGAILWNTGISNRTGPFRVNVEIAEALATMGITVLRFDLSRLGDSEDLGEKIEIQERSTRDLSDAADLLAAEYGCEQLLLIGLCSSAVDAYYFARSEPRVLGLIMVDTFVYPTFAHKLLYYWQRISSLARWKRLLKRRLLPRRMRPELPVQDYFEANYPPPLQARDDLKAMMLRGSELLVIYTGGFASYFSHASQFEVMLESSGFGKQLQLHIWPETDHLFTMLEDRAKLIDSITHWLRSTLLRLQERAPAILLAPEPQLPAIAAQAGEAVPTLVQPQPLPFAEEPTPQTSPLFTRQQLVETILKVYNQVLYPAEVEAKESFFDAGATSLQAIRAVALLGSELQVQVSIVDIYATPEADRFAAVLLERGMQPAFTDPQSLESGFAPEQLAQPLAAASSHVPFDDSIAIIGIACCVPGAKDWRAFWQLVLEGRESITFMRPDELDPSLPAAITEQPNYVPARGLIEGDRFDHAFFGINRREALFTDPQQRILLETCWQALEDAGYSASRSQHRVAVYAGVGGNSYFSRNLMRGHAEPHSEEEYLALLANDKDYVATRIAYALNLKGPAVSVHTACSTSLVAVIEAIKTLLVGDADLAIAGAAAVNAPMASGHLYQEGGIFSRDGHCRPFSAEATGTMFSDGAAVVVLKRLSQAQRDGDSIYAVIKGWGLNNDGSSKSSFAAPSIDGQAAAIKQAYSRAGWSARSVGFVECHGTATPIGDPIEVEGLRRAFQASTRETQFCGLGSVKGLIGHLTAAAGTIGLIKAALVVKEGIIPPSLRGDHLNPELRLEQSPFYVPRTRQPWTQQGPRRAGISSFGVGGTNAHVLIEAAPAPLPAPTLTPTPDPWIVLQWSAQDSESCQRLGEVLASNWRASTLPLQHVAHHLLTRRERWAYRQTLVGTDRASLDQAWRRAAPPKKKSRTPAPALVLLFPGQGSQYPMMGLELAKVWPRFAEHYERVLELFARSCQLPLAQLLAAPAEAAALHSTAVTQPALFSLEWALAQALIDSGLRPQTLIGHSIGELAAACIAGVFELSDAVTIVSARGAAMQAAAPGGMLAVRSNWSRIQAWTSPELALAAVNGPEAIVVAGPLAALATLRERLAAEEIACRQLETSHAFHAPAMDAILPRFAQAFAGISLKAPQIPILSTRTGQILSAATARDPQHWLQQIRQPVLFADAIRALPQREQFFLEVGPRDALTRLLPTLCAESVQMSPTLPSQLNESQGMAAAIAALWEAGLEIFQAPVRPSLSLPAYPFRGERLWLEPKQAASAISPESRPLSAHQPSHSGRSHLKAQDLNSAPGTGPHERGSFLGDLSSLLGDLSGLKPAELGPKRSWNDLGLDSLLLTQWALKVQKIYQVDMNLQRLQSQLPHLEALATYLATKRPELLSPPPQIEEVDVTSTTRPEDSSLLTRLMERQLDLIEQQLKLMELLRIDRQDSDRLVPEGKEGDAPWLQPPASDRGKAQQVLWHGKPEPRRDLRPQREAASGHVVAIASGPDFLDTLPQDGEVTLFTDGGLFVLPRYQGSFLAKDASGQPALFIAHPERAYEIWQIMALASST